MPPNGGKSKSKKKQKKSGVGEKVKCNLCNNVVSKNHLPAHLRSLNFPNHREANIKQLYICSTCNHSFAGKSNYEKHIKKVHPDGKRPNTSNVRSRQQQIESTASIRITRKRTVTSMASTSNPKGSVTFAQKSDEEEDDKETRQPGKRRKKSSSNGDKREKKLRVQKQHTAVEKDPEIVFASSPENEGDNILDNISQFGPTQPEKTKAGQGGSKTFLLHPNKKGVIIAGVNTDDIASGVISENSEEDEEEVIPDHNNDDGPPQNQEEATVNDQNEQQRQQQEVNEDEEHEERQSPAFNDNDTGRKNTNQLGVRLDILLQWDYVDSTSSFDGGPLFIKHFFSGELSNVNIETADVLKFFIEKPENLHGFIFPSLFLLEFCTIVIDIEKKLLSLYEGLRKSKTVHSRFKQLVSSITMQRLQQGHYSNTYSCKVPSVLEDNLDIRPFLNTTTTMAGGSRDDFNSMTKNVLGELTYLDIEYFGQVENVLLGIISAPENYLKGNAQNQVQEEGRKYFCMSLVKAIIGEMMQSNFKSYYQSMIYHSIEMMTGGTVVYLETTNNLEIVHQVRLHSYNASRHGIPKPSDATNIPKVNLSASGGEIKVFTDLIYNINEAGNCGGIITYKVYKMAKAVKAPSIKKFLFGSKDIAQSATPSNRKDILLISIEQGYHDIFTTVPCLKNWIITTEKGPLLQQLSTDQIIWLFNHKNIPFQDEFDVYCQLVKWSLRRNGVVGVDQEAFKKYGKIKSPHLNDFLQVYEEVLCLLDLQDHFESILKDEIIPKDLIFAAIKEIRNPTG